MSQFFTNSSVGATTLAWTSASKLSVWLWTAGSTASASRAGNDQEDYAPNPFNQKYNLKVTPWIIIPSYISLIASSAISLYIIYKHFRSLLEIYISVIFYLISQFLLLITLTGSWIVELLFSGGSETRCQIKLAVQAFTIILPGYTIMIISIVRSVFLTYPLSYLHYLKLKTQLLGFGAACLVCSLISAIPLFGLCPAEHYIRDNESGLEFCTQGDKRKPSCTVFFSILLSVGFLLPVLAVICLYGYIYNVALKARKSHKQLSLTSSSSTSTDTSKAGRKEKTERRSVPWSIIAILAVSITTTLPWAAMMLFEVEVTEMLAEGGDISVLFDLFYSLLQVLISCSPLVYLLTTNSLRLIVFRKIRNIFK